MQEVVVKQSELKSDKVNPQAAYDELMKMAAILPDEGYFAESILACSRSLVCNARRELLNCYVSYCHYNPNPQLRSELQKALIQMPRDFVPAAKIAVAEVKEVKAVVAEKTKESSFDKNTVIDLCLNKSCEKYAEQKTGFSAALQAVESNEPLSVDLIKKLHTSYVPLKEIDIYKDPAFYTAEDENHSGEFRRDIVGTSGLKSDESLTQQGIAELLNVIKSESKDNFPLYNGTWMGPVDHARKTVNFARSIHHSNLAEKQGALTDQEFAKQILSEVSTEEYAVLFPRTNDKSLTIQQYMQVGLEKLVNEFNSRIKSIDGIDDKIKLIVEFIKKSLRLHPFRDCNHRVIVGGLLNYLLLREGIGICKIEDRRQFILNGLDESIAAVKKALVPMSELKSKVAPVAYGSPRKLGIFAWESKVAESQTVDASKSLQRKIA